jgi:hypothetical protein
MKRRKRGWMAIASIGLTASAAAQSSPPKPAEPGAADAVMREMSHHGPEAAANPHVKLSAQRPATTADSTRGAHLVADIRRHLARYRSVAAARADGYEQFLPNLSLPVYHFTNRRHGLEAAFRFDPARPTSLLYRKNPDGTFTLTGVMYTAPALVSEASLDRRIPRGLTRWHQHVNWCLPRKGEESRWLERRSGKPLFGPESPIVTRAACDAAAGRFFPRVFGWMVHINAFESDDPRIIWGEHH